MTTTNYTRVLFALGIFLYATCGCNIAADPSSAKDIARRGTEQAMMLDIDLQEEEVFFGESVLFTITLSHSFDEPLSVASFQDTNRSVTITVKGADNRISTADQMSHKERDGLFIEPPRTPEGTSLPPGETMVLKGDLLEWFGVMKPGLYSVSASYKGIMRNAESSPANLRILPLLAGVSTCPCCSRFGDPAPWSAAYTHKGKGSTIIFYQQLSPYMPDNPVHCFKAATVTGEEIRPMAALVENNDCPDGHVYWVDRDNNLYLARVSIDTGEPDNLIKAALDGSLNPVNAALSLKDGSVITLWDDKKTGQCVLLSIDDSGKIIRNQHHLEGMGEESARTFIWERGQRLHLFWSDAASAMIRYATINLADMSEGLNDPIQYHAERTPVWMDGYLDASLSQQELRSLYLGKGDEGTKGDKRPRPVLWAVFRDRDRMLCSRIDMRTGEPSNNEVLQSKALNGCKIVSSAVSTSNALCLLFADDSGSLHYASTSTGKIRPIRKMSRQNILLSNDPCLIKGLSYDSVYLRYTSKERGIEYLRMEYDESKAPVE
ncbi:MAG TPA: hypothetical protein PLM29_04610 [Deltaproteobacteria bacterium]|nr:hypothetical protein [Deltaproteobacteria bacterium]